MDSLKAAIVERVGAHRADILDLARALVAIPTENPPGRAYLPCCDLLASQLGDLGIAHRVVDVPAAGRFDAGLPRRCLLASHGEGSRAVVFHGHYDVVPAQHAAQFQPRVERGRLVGRGSSDMKCGLAAMIYAVHVLQELDVPLRGRVELCLVPDEETGGQGGSAWLVQAGLLGTDAVAMLTPEPTSGVVWHANRGAVTVAITVRGVPAHVGLQHSGVNAFEGMLDAAAALRELKREVEARTTSFRLRPDEARRSILLLGGRVEGGTNFNVVPDRVTFTVDRRFNPEEDIDVEKARLFEVLDRVRERGVALDVDVIQESVSAGGSDCDPIALALADTALEVEGRRPDFEMCPGSLETRWYAQRGIPAFAYGPGLLEVSHGPDEYVELERVFQHASLYAMLAARVLADGGAR
ncbi:MAG: ArgE/DapE family deacylase [Acidobacteria bacterium]|nr:ArgE/DapE family deacylase [Acidobacteriota bacterium]